MKEVVIYLCKVPGIEPKLLCHKHSMGFMKGYIENPLRNFRFTCEGPKGVCHECTPHMTFKSIRLLFLGLRSRLSSRMRQLTR